VLWRKTWLETRSRFLIALAIFVAGAVQVASRLAVKDELQLNDFRIHMAHVELSFLWILWSVLLMMGGLLRERTAGTALFTLALPVTRLRILGLGIALRLGQCVALVVAPCVAFFATAEARGVGIDASQSLLHIELMLVGGLPFIAAAILISSIVEGEYAAPSISLAIIFADAAALAVEKTSPLYFLREYNPWHLMVDSTQWDSHAMTLTPIRWDQAVPALIVTVGMTMFAFRSIQRRDF
jgi:hypothetical protein